MQSKNVVAVFGYGCHMVPELREYIDRVVAFLQKCPSGTDVLFTGGYTQRNSAPGISEADFLKEWVFLGNNCNDLPPLHRHIDRDAYTTEGNVLAIKALLEKLELLNNPGVSLTIFCEATRALKVDILVRHRLGRRAKIETVSWEQGDPVGELWKTLYDWLGTKIPYLARLWRNRRIARSYHI